jgi:hypothetical protein
MREAQRPVAAGISRISRFSARPCARADWVIAQALDGAMPSLFLSSQQ